MKSKFLLITAILILSLCFSISAFADAKIHSETKNIVVSGTAENVTSNYVSVCLKINGSVEHLGQANINSDKTYKYKFKTSAELENYELTVNAGGTVLTDVTVTSTEEKLFSIDLDLKSANTSQVDRNNMYVEFDMDNTFGDAGECTLILAFYDEEELYLMGQKIIENFKYGYDGKQAKIGFVVPKNVKKIKAFAWQNITTLMPLTKNATLHNQGFQDGQIVSLIGTSVDAGVGTDFIHFAYLEYLYKTKFLNTRPDLLFQNNGIAGDGFVGAKARLDWDIFTESELKKANPSPFAVGNTLQKDPNTVVILMGINDTVGFATNGFTDSAKQNVETAATNCEILIDELRNKGIENITLASTTVVREASNTGDVEGYQQTLQYLEDKLKELAAEKGIKFVPTYSEVDNYLKKDESIVVATETDGIHVNANAHILMAYTFAKHQELAGDIASVEINGNNVEVVNAEVTGFSNTGSQISYTYTPQSLPLATDTYYLNAEKVTTIEEDFNTELIKVMNLASGKYEVSLDGESIGIFTADQLAKGINIAKSDKNPNQVISQELYNIYKELSQRIKGIRCIPANLSIYGRQLASFSDGVDLLAGRYKDENGQIVPISSTKFEYSDYVEDVHNLRAQATQKAVPETYQVQIIRQ